MNEYLEFYENLHQTSPTAAQFTKSNLQ